MIRVSNATLGRAVILIEDGESKQVLDLLLKAAGGDYYRSCSEIPEAVLHAEQTPERILSNCVFCAIYELRRVCGEEVPPLEYTARELLLKALFLYGPDSLLEYARRHQPLTDRGDMA